MALPTLETPRLSLRPFVLDDAPRVQVMAQRAEVAATSLNIPHPYPVGLAAQWIAGHGESSATGVHTLAIHDRARGLLVGAVTLVVNDRHRRAELGYWIGHDHWNQGYATEAVQRVIRWGFETLGLNRIFAQHFSNNPASGRVMQKAGMHYEGLLRQCVQKDGVFYDTAIYAILRTDPVHCEP